MKLFKRKQKLGFDFKAENEILRLELDKRIAQCEKLEKILEKRTNADYKHACEVNNLENKVKELESHKKHSIEAELAYNLLQSLKAILKDEKTSVMSNLDVQRQQHMASLQSMGGQQFRGLLTGHASFIQ